MKRFLTLFLTLCALSQQVWAQSATLRGTLTDDLTGEPVMGATVYLLEAGKGAYTLDDGSFAITGLPAGTHTPRISMIGYLTDTLAAITLKAGETYTLTTQLRSREATTVVITSTRVTNTEAATVAETQTAEEIVSVIGSEQIQKNQERNSADVIRRLPGVTLMENRFVMVRGLNERYNAVLLNGGLTPSAEADKKAFSFDVLPSGVLDRIVICKTGAPELPGEFGGGVIKVYTRNVPDSNGIQVTWSSSVRPGTTFGQAMQAQGGKYDFLGMDDGTRALPAAFPQSLYRVTGESLTHFGRMLPNHWTLTPVTALPDNRLSVLLSRKFQLGSVEVGNITSLSYSNTRETWTAENLNYNAWNPTSQRSDTIYHYQDATFHHSMRTGVLHNWSFRFSPNHSLQFRNLLNQSGSAQNILRTGVNMEEGFEVKNYAMRWQQRTLYNGQLQGEHRLNQDATRLEWTLGFSQVLNREPDFRRIRTVRDLAAQGTDTPFQVVIAPAASSLDAGRFYSSLNERLFMGAWDLEHTLRIKEGKFQPKLRLGMYAERKDRSFNARWMSYKKASTSQFDNNLLNQPLETLFSPENINTSTGFKLEEGTNPSDAYTAANTLLAAYAGASIPLTPHLSLSTGVRVEHNTQELYSRTFSNQVIAVKNPVLSPLPSANLTWQLRDSSTQVRFAWSHTVNRPEFRELAPFAYYDFSFNNVLYGNDSLRTAQVHNYDIRWERYPAPGEMISFGIFCKDFVHPIETFFVPGSGSGGTRNFTFRNADRSLSLGAETEIRKTLQGLTASPVLSRLGAVVNASVIYSRVNLGDQAIGQRQSRPMMGQSPWIVNTGLYYDDRDHGFQANVLWNVIGKRLFAVGTFGTPDIYELPRNVVDLNLSQRISRVLEVKVSWQDMLNASTRLMQDSNENGKIDSQDETIMRYRKGMYLTAGISARF